MIELIDLLPIIGYMLAGLCVGVLAGLLPALPTWTGPFLLLQFHSGMSLTELLVFWITVYAGSQFFGSIAVITTKIPGEESALVYIEDLDKFSLTEKNYLLYDTALGSAVAALIASVLLWVAVSYTEIGQLPFIFSVKTQVVVYTAMLLSFIVLGGKKWFWVLLTMLFGASIAPAQNYALPQLWYDWQWIFDGYTFYLVLLGTLVIPSMFSYNISIDDDAAHEHYAAKNNKHFHWWMVMKASIVGFVAGLIPGPSASIGSVGAYKMLGNTPGQKIVAAETANNSAVIASIIPFFVLALPVNNNTILMSGIMDMHGLLVSDDILNASGFFSLSVIDLVCLVLFLSVGLFYLLSTMLIDFYVKVIVLLHSKINLVLTFIVGLLIYLDLQSADITVLHYFTLLAVFTCLGFVMKRYKITAIPLMFSVLLGDKAVWAFIQIPKLYF